LPTLHIIQSLFMPILKSLVFFLLATLVACSDSMNSSELDPNEAVQPEMPMSPAQVPMVPATCGCPTQRASDFLGSWAIGD